jgi:hypothetical protein
MHILARFLEGNACEAAIKRCGFKSRPEHQSKGPIFASKVNSLLTGWPEFQVRKFAEGAGELGPPGLRFQNRDDFVGVGVFCAAIILRASDSLSANTKRLRLWHLLTTLLAILFGFVYVALRRNLWVLIVGHGFYDAAHALYPRDSSEASRLA